MVSLFILKSNMRGTQYGIGTYLNNVIDFLTKKTEANIFIINYMTEIYCEFRVVKKSSRFSEIYIPCPIISLKSERNWLKYSNRVVDLLSEFITPDSIFQVNYLDALQIVKVIKFRTASKIVSVIHSAQWQFAFDGNKQKFINSWLQRNNYNYNSLTIKMIELEKELYEISDRIISVTAYMKDFIMNYYNISGDKIDIVPNGINNSIFHNTNKINKIVLKQTLGFGKREKIILYVGRLDKNKGLFFLLAAFAEVIKQFKNVRLVIAGEDSGPDKISQYLKHCNNMWGKVTFTGFIDYEQITRLYQVADIGIIPSIFDHCPYVALEMIGHNVPLIMSKTDGLTEILNDNQCIFINPITDIEGNIKFNVNEISNSILNLLKKVNSKICYLTADYKGLIESKFSNERMGQELFSILINMESQSINHLQN